VGASDADTTAKEAAQKAASAAIAEPLDVLHKFYMDGKSFIGGATPSIADIRGLQLSLNFLRLSIIRCLLEQKLASPSWRTPLGKAYAEPAADVRGRLISERTAVTTGSIACAALTEAKVSSRHSLVCSGLLGLCHRHRYYR
jgi:glutathione S-transferase